jgi:hypothetical protein
VRRATHVEGDFRLDFLSPVSHLGAECADDPNGIRLQIELKTKQDVDSLEGDPDPVPYVVPCCTARADASASRLFARSARTEVRLTPRWREADSNHQYREAGDRGLGGTICCSRCIPRRR